MWRTGSPWDELSARLRSLVGQRARSLWQQEGCPPDRTDALVQRARREVEAEFRRRVAAAGNYRRRWNPPLEIEEALTPGHRRQPGGLKWVGARDRRGR